MDEHQQKLILGVLGVMALVAGIGWGYTLANEPRAATPTPEPALPVAGGTVAQDYAATARTLDRRWVRCPVPRNDLEADGHLFDPEVDQGQLYGFVYTESGSALLRTPDGKPVLQAVWHHALPGGEGTCNTQPPEVARASGRMEGATSGTVVSSCADGLADVDADGAFEVDVLIGHPCTLWFVGSGPSGELVARDRLTAAPGPLEIVLRSTP